MNHVGEIESDEESENEIKNNNELKQSFMPVSKKKQIDEAEKQLLDDIKNRG